MSINAIVLKLVNMSITASWLIAAVILVRLALKKAPKWISCLLWAFVAIRLICPFSIESAFSLLPNTEVIPEEIRKNEEISPDTLNRIDITDRPTDQPGVSAITEFSVAATQSRIPIWTMIWSVGLAVMLMYSLVSYIRLKRRVRASISMEENIRVCDEVKSPFILGVLKPQIYVPSSMTGETLSYVITHEKAHMKRYDHLWKPFGYLLLAVYWFNPLCWIAYILLCRDIEMACDERVIRDLNHSDKAAYSQALLDCSFPRKRIAACPLAFGEVGVKERVKSVLNYKKPAFWVIIVAVASCVVVAICFLTNPKTEKPVDDGEVKVVKWFDSMNGNEGVWGMVREITLDEFPGVTFRCDQEVLVAVTEKETSPLYYGMPIWNVYLCDLNGDGKAEFCSTTSFGSGIIDDRFIIYDYANGEKYEKSDRTQYDYTLNLKNDKLVVEKRKYQNSELLDIGELVFRDNTYQIDWGIDDVQLNEGWYVSEKSYYPENYSGYRFPVLPGTEEWPYDNHQKMIDICQVTKEICDNLSTDELLQTVLSYPLAGDMYAFDDGDVWYNIFKRNFIGLQEFEKRPDAKEVLKVRYLQEMRNPVVVSPEIGSTEVDSISATTAEQEYFRTILRKAVLSELYRRIIEKPE